MPETQTVSDPSVGLRYLRKADLPHVVAVERKLHEYVDPDFGVPQVRCYAWDEDDFISAVRQYKSKSRATPDTRSWVLDEVDGEKSRVVGSLVYEIQKDGYEVLLMSAEHDAARRRMLDYLASKLSQSESRNRCTYLVPDGDYAALKFLMNNGFSVKLLPNPTGYDAWKCERVFEHKPTE